MSRTAGVIAFFSDCYNLKINFTRMIIVPPSLSKYSRSAAAIRLNKQSTVDRVLSKNICN
jgi:hypothetical protein